MKRWLRRLVRLVLGALALVALTVAIVVVTVHTDWGRERLRLRIEAALERACPGGARIGAIDGSVFGTVTVRGVEIDGCKGAPRIAADELRVRLALWPLLDQTVRVDDAVVVGARVVVQGSGQPAPASGPAVPAAAAWRVELQRVAVHDGSVELHIGGATQTLSALEVQGSATIEGARVAVTGAANGSWGAVQLAASGAVLVDRVVRVPDARATLGAAEVVARELVIDVDHPSGTLTLRAPAGALQPLIEQAGARSEALPKLGALSGTIALTSAATSRLAVDLTCGSSVLWAALDGEPARRKVRGLISVAGVELAQLSGGRTAGSGQVLAAIDGSADRLRGTLLLHADGADVPVHDATIAIDAVLDEAGLSLAKLVAFGRGDGGLQVVASGGLQRTDGTLQLDQVRIAASATAIELPEQRITGKLAVSAQASGTIQPASPIAVTGSVSGRGVAVDKLTALPSGRIVPAQLIAIAGLDGRFALRVGSGKRGALPGLYLDDAELSATDVGGYGNAQLSASDRGDGRLDVTAHAQPPLRGLEIATQARVSLVPPGAALARTEVTAPGQRWVGDGGRIVVNDRAYTVMGLALHSGDATVSLAGALLRPSGAIEAHIAADRLPAEMIDPAFRGVSHSRIELTRLGGRWTIDGRFDVGGLALGTAAEPFDASAHVTLVGQRATLDAQATSAQLGSAGLAVEVAAPRNPFDMAAWRALSADAIHRATLRAQRLALAGVAGVAGLRDAALSGTLDGTVELAPGAFGGELALRDVDLSIGPAIGQTLGAPPAAVVRSEPSPRGLEADIAFAAQDGDLATRTRVRLSEIAAADLTAQFAIPARPFDPASWRRGGRDLVKQASFALADVAFDPALLARLGVEQLLAAHGINLPYRGHAAVALTLGAAAGDARLAVDLTDVTGGALVEPISQHLAISAGPTGTQLEARWAGPGFALGQLDAALPITTEGWLANPAAALTAPLTARWTLSPTPLAPILALLGRHDLIAGTVEGSASVGGTLTAPTIAPARVIARDLVAAPRLGGRPSPTLAELVATASWDGAIGSLEINGREASGGTLRITATGRPGAPGSATGALTATRLDIAPLAALWSRAGVPTAGTVDAALTLAAGGGVTGTLKLTDGALPIAPSVGTLRDVAADLTIDGRAVAGTIDGKLGRGTVHLAAGISADGTTEVKELTLREVSTLGALRPVITATLTAPKLRFEDLQLRGDVIVRDAHITLPEHTGTTLLDSTVPSDLILVGAGPAAAAGPPPPARPIVAINVIAGPTQLTARQIAEGVGFDGTLHTDQLRIVIGGGLTITGDVELDSGDVDILGRRYQLDPSAVQFDGSFDPRLAIDMSHQFADLALGVGLRGRVSRPELQLYSDPAGYSREQLLGFFVGGEPGGDPSSQTGEAVKGALALGISGIVGRRLTKALPIQLDALSCEPATTATSASCTVGKWLSQRLFLSYRQHLDPLPDENASDVQVQYRFGRKSLEVTGGDRAHYGADLLWRRRW